MHNLDNDVVRIKQPESFFSIEMLKLIMWQLYQGVIDFWPSTIAFIGMIYFAISKKRYYYLSKPTISTNY